MRKEIILVTPRDAEKEINISPSTIEAISNNGYLTKYWVDARFYYNQAEINCLKGLDITALLGFGGDILGTCKELEYRLSKL